MCGVLNEYLRIGIQHFAQVSQGELAGTHCLQFFAQLGWSEEILLAKKLQSPKRFIINKKNLIFMEGIQS
jgi:hypothetical protein